MPTFEVTIETPDDGGTTLTLVVDAEHWVAAWREGLRVMGVRTPPTNAVCEVGQDSSVRIAVPDASESWLVRPRPATRTTRPAIRAKPAIDGYPRAPASAVEPISLRVRPPEAGGAATAEPTTRRTPADGARDRVDPKARRLDTGDRARLRNVGRRVGIPDAPRDTEAPTTGRRPRGESTRVGRPSLPATGDRADTPASELTSAFSVMESDVTLLPQQFRAIAAAAGQTSTGGPALRAVENAWQHIPCQLVQTLRYSDRDTLEVVAARGERERETLRCRLEASGVFEHLLSPRPARVKFSEDKTRLRYVDGRGEVVLEQPVRSAACVPITVGGRRWGVLLLLNSTRASGFAEGELRAVSYLSATLGRELTATR
jgi:hypothetical protein